MIKDNLLLIKQFSDKFTEHVIILQRFDFWESSEPVQNLSEWDREVNMVCAYLSNADQYIWEGDL